MPKNIKGGNKTKKGKNTRKVQPLVLSTQDTKYAVVVANLGNGRCNLNLVGKMGIECEAQGYIRGCVRRAKFVKDDLVLCGLRDFGGNKEIKEVDIILKYTLDHYTRLVEMGEIKSLGITPEEDDCGIDFNNDSYSEDEDDYQINEEPNGDKLIDDKSNDNTEDDKLTNNESDLDKPTLDSDRKIKTSVQKKLDTITNNSKKTKEMAKIQRNLKKNNEVFDIMNSQIDNFKFDDI